MGAGQVEVRQECAPRGDTKTHKHRDSVRSEQLTTGKSTYSLRKSWDMNWVKFPKSAGKTHRQADRWEGSGQSGATEQREVQGSDQTDEDFCHFSFQDRLQRFPIFHKQTGLFSLLPNNQGHF